VSVGIGDLRWPAFNVADPSLVIGIIILLVFLTFFDRAEATDESGGEPA
jgi:lipoprotein signal peptidase